MCPSILTSQPLSFWSSLCSPFLSLGVNHIHQCNLNLEFMNRNNVLLFMGIPTEKTKSMCSPVCDYQTTRVPFFLHSNYYSISPTYINPSIKCPATSPSTSSGTCCSDQTSHHFLLASAGDYPSFSTSRTGHCAFSLLMAGRDVNLLPKR